MDSGYVKVCNSYSDCKAWLGAEPRPSKLALLERVKNNKNKYRLILDCKRGPGGDVQQGVNQGSRLAERIILPRGSDVTEDLLALAALDNSGRDIEMMILDFTDAFFQVELRRSERPFFVASFKKKWLVFLTIAPGYKNAPLIWGRL